MQHHDGVIVVVVSSRARVVHGRSGDNIRQGVHFSRFFDAQTSSALHSLYSAEARIQLRFRPIFVRSQTSQLAKITYVNLRSITGLSMSLESIEVPPVVRKISAVTQAFRCRARAHPRCDYIVRMTQPNERDT